MTSETLSLEYIPSLARMGPIKQKPAGWATVRSRMERGNGWRTGHRAGALAALVMLATGTGVAGYYKIKRPVT